MAQEVASNDLPHMCQFDNEYSRNAFPDTPCTVLYQQLFSDYQAKTAANQLLVATTKSSILLGQRKL